MKKRLFALVFVVVSSLCFAQNGYKKVYNYDEFNKDWALVKTISGTYGFIDRKGSIVVQPIYSKITKFEYSTEKYALVKNIVGAYGFIDRNGKEIISARYWNKNDAIEKLKTLKI